MTRRRLPNRDECRSGIPLALGNADGHLDAADILAANGKFGFAVAHLVYALEESEKARTLGKVVIGGHVTDEELHSALYDHRSRHVGAVGKSWTSGAAALFMQSSKERLFERLAHLEPRSDQERWGDILANHPEVLPRDWAENAGPTRERSLYVDLKETGWSSPAETPAEHFHRLRPAASRQVAYVRAAYQREVLAAEDTA